MTETPELLYHYTTPEGLVGIVADRHIWATRALYLNDAKEIRHAFDVTKDLLTAFESRNRSGTQAFRDYLDETQIIPWVFITAWTEEGDQLSQWRGYGKGGPAYSIGFERGALQQAAAREGWRLEQCVYRPEDQEALLRRELERFYTAFEEGRLNDPQGGGSLKPDDPQSDPHFASFLFGFLLVAAPLIKNEAFAEEKEWRLISPVTNARVLHRAGRHAIVPYRCFPLPVRESTVHKDGILDVRRIVIGPTPDELQAFEGVRSLFLKTTPGPIDPDDGVLHGGIDHSAIPYRYW
jgi:hypothetical protein